MTWVTIANKQSGVSGDPPGAACSPYCPKEALIHCVGIAALNKQTNRQTQYIHFISQKNSMSYMEHHARRAGREERLVLTLAFSWENMLDRAESPMWSSLLHVSFTKRVWKERAEREWTCHPFAVVLEGMCSMAEGILSVSLNPNRVASCLFLSRNEYVSNRRKRLSMSCASRGICRAILQPGKAIQYRVPSCMLLESKSILSLACLFYETSPWREGGR